MQDYLTVLKKYAVFSGRAARKEYWMFVLFNLIIMIVLGIIDNNLGLKTQMGTGALGGLYNLAVLIPSLAVSFRRLHDIGRTGWWILLGFVPIIGWIVLLVFAVTDSQPGQNAYGPNPKGGLSR